MYKQLSELLKRADMQTRKWLSNSDEVLRNIPAEDRATEVEIEGDPLPGTKTLGVLWLATEDVFTFRFNKLDMELLANCTKRIVLKKVASLFDPLGFLAPFIVRAKILLQKMWISGADWDEPLSEQLTAEVVEWFSELPDVSKIQVSRCLQLKESEKLASMSLHVFADASADAYGAVAYTRCAYEGGRVSCHFVCAKTRVTPLESTSIPRLELMAAVLALRVGQSVAATLELSTSMVTFWTDSMNVICWIRNRSRSYKPFVANRVGEIQTSTNPQQWRHVPTAQNPADIASRGSTAAKLATDALWWSGPEFLSESIDQWPTQPTTNTATIADATETRKSGHCEYNATLLTVVVKLGDRLDPSRFSDWIRLSRVHAWVWRFANNCRLSKQDRKNGELHRDEIQESQTLLLKACQQETFGDEYRALIHQKPLPAQSKLLVLNPQLDEDGVIRSNSRLVNADMLAYEARYPIILPRKHSITQLIVKHEHELGAHVCGTNQILSELSKKYWIVAAREAVREWENDCMECKRRTAKRATQIMAPLPSSRLTQPEPLRSFSHTALDFAGPFITVRGRGKSREKRYLCLFTCMSTRAVHLEMAYGLDTDSFLNALYRFANRRAWPDEFTSDNGSNFVGANRELRELVSQLNRNKIEKSTSPMSVKWNFNPPAAPHFGGVFEIMIKAAKRAVFAILGNADVTDEELTSAFIAAEALLNSRPLTYQSANSHDLLPLTPSHFLHGELGRRSAPIPGSTENVTSLTKRWRRVQELVRHFWRRWLQEWIPGLASRKKWNKAARNLTVGDVVIVMNTETARGLWPLGRIIEVLPGKDGLVRVAKVRVGKTVFTRSINYLCPLECAPD